MKSFHKTPSGKWRKKMRACSTVPSTNQIFGSWERQCGCWDSHLPQNVCVCVCDCPSRPCDLSFHVDALGGCQAWRLPAFPAVCSGAQEGSPRVGLRQARAVWGQQACSLVCASASRGCLSFLCASLRTGLRPEIKGSFLPNCTSASLRAVRIAEVVQVLKRVWSRKSFSGTLCSETCF